VFATLHTSSAAGTINRIIDVFPTNQQEQIRTQLASAVIGILCQQLLRKIGGGRVAAFETLVVTPGIANLIRENKIFRITSSIQTGAKHGMMLLDDYIFNLWREGQITKEDGLGKCNSADELARRFAAAERGIFDDQPQEQEAERV
jgi:twitching motility protein PilT